LIKAANEARAIARGEADPATYKVFVPAKIDVKAIRAKTDLTQEEFSIRFAISLASLRDWEQGRFSPDPTPRAQSGQNSFPGGQARRAGGGRSRYRA
jgi:putative transcriptional regulator